MAAAAVHIDRAGSVGVGAFIAGFGRCIRIVLMRVVAYVLRRGATAFMLAVACHRSPAELHRQKSYQ